LPFSKKRYSPFTLVAVDGDAATFGFTREP
jgi:hypothetical protein